MQQSTKTTRILFLIFLLVMLGYVVFSARHVLTGPQIHFATDDQVLTVDVQVIELYGTTQNAQSLTLNGRSVLMDEHNAFTERVLLSPGLNIFTLTATDKYDRTRTESISVHYAPPHADVLQYNGDISNIIDDHGNEEDINDQE